EFIEQNRAIKLAEFDDFVQIGVCDPTDRELRQTLEHFHRKKTVFFQIDPAELAGFLSLKFSRSDQKELMQDTGEDERLLLDRLANDAPVVNLVNNIFIDAIRQGASDIHIEIFGNEMVVRYRIDGYLQISRRMDHTRFRAISTRIKIMANMNIMESRMPQDGRITVHLAGGEIDMRVSIVPIADGESIVLRLFDKNRTPLKMEDLGMTGHDITRLEQVCRLPNGLILATGPTGTGKTTTLNAVLHHIKDETLKIIAIEDPIEYVNAGVNQIQTNDAIGLSFSTLLRRVLRQDPNIILVGEIRDADTAELAVRAALTGHLVLSTLHTNDALSVITRLKNIGIEPYLIAAVLRASLAERLVRRLCPECREITGITAEEQELFARHQIPVDALFKARGCPKCHLTGYSGRVGLFELFVPDRATERMIIADAGEESILAHALDSGMETLLSDGLKKAAAGITTVSEIAKVAAI
ncbi:MAG: type II/IV secretion system protein, partial [Spirochaetales bacterium]|nr:type II/IV secretion system protein [Spirochaetales bacterium]